MTLQPAAIGENIAAFEGMQADLVLAHYGKWVVLHDKALVGAYESFNEAAFDAMQRFERNSYMIRRVGFNTVCLPPSVMIGHPRALNTVRP